VFGALYVLPAVGAAIWIGPRAGAATAIAGGVAYAAHAALGLSGDAMLVAIALITSATVVFVGSVAAALVAARERDRERHADDERRLQREAVAQALAALSRALRARDDATAAHCERVARLAEAIARRLGLGPERVELARLAALVHDIGKIGVRDDILLKPTPLTPEERARIEHHPAVAADLLRGIRSADSLAAIVLAHHEASDGSGYPRGLRHADIPVEARILHIADVYDALTAERPYKDALPGALALQVMHERQHSFDEAALAALEEVLGQPRERAAPVGSPVS
jgi:putative nucleotidyltransferase with HDIG domain